MLYIEREREYLLVISARAWAMPCLPAAAAEVFPVPFFILSPFEEEEDDNLALLFMPCPSTFPFRLLYKFPMCDDLFNFVVTFGRRLLPAAPPIPRGGGGGVEPPGERSEGGGGGGLIIVPLFAPLLTLSFML